ncbi:DUF2599 domain-containing protein [Nocardia fluminea]|uniref:DUF2599 domain-containing protein n=1 Tax=Nocardia fluminea TaxID=134984 RepID=UPI00366B60BF
MNRASWPRTSRSRRVVPVLGAMIVGALLAVAPASVVHAEAKYPIAWTGIGIHPQSAPSMGSGPAAPALPDGATVTVVCEQKGGPVNNGDKTIDVWERLDTGAWLPNAFIKTGHDGFTPGIPKCSDYFARTVPGAKDPYADQKKVEEKVNTVCGGFISSARWVDRGENELKSLEVTPTTCGLVTIWVNKQAAFDELYHKISANWGGNEYWSMHNQFTCHSDWWWTQGKQKWNLEPKRPNVGYWNTMTAQCNPKP